MSIDVQTEIRNTCLYKGGHFAVLMAAADCANTLSGEGIYPGIDLWAANARLEIRRTQDIILELRRDKVLVLIGQDGQDLDADVKPTGGRGRKTEYRINLERVQELQGLHEAESGFCPFCEARRKRAERRSGKGAISAGKGAISGGKDAKKDAKGAISSAHIEPSLEPSLEPSIEPPEEPPQASAPVATSLFPDLAMGDPKPKARRHLEPRELDAAYAAYDAASEKTGWAKVQMRSAARDAALTNRLKELGGLSGWHVALTRASDSDFCCGKIAPVPPRTKPFMADFDFLTQQSSLIKLMEGKYDNHKGPAQPGGGGTAAIAARVAARRAANRAHGDAPG